MNDEIARAEDVLEPKIRVVSIVASNENARFYIQPGFSGVVFNNTGKDVDVEGSENVCLKSGESLAIGKH